MGGLQAEDYKEPRCLSCTDFYEPGKDAAVIPIPVGRILDRLDRYFDGNDMDGAQQHLEFWLAQAREGRDRRGMVTVLNELMGLYRKRNKQDEALQCAREAGAAVEQLGMADSITAGTVFLNMATVYAAFGRQEESLLHYQRAQVIYEMHLEPGDARLGGLYNNMALAYAAAGEYQKAAALYQKALQIMENVPNGKLEMAITYLNMANAAEAEKGMVEAEETIHAYLTLAECSLNEPTLPRNGYYAFVCEKCAPTFDYYGWFLTKEDLKRRAAEIYEGTGTR